MAERSREPEALAPTLTATASSSPAPTSGSRPAALPDDTLPFGEVVGDRYRVVELVGRGGQGDVYRAEDLEVEGHVVALKLMHRAARSDDERATAMRELRMLAAVSHPAIVQFKDSGWYGARLWFVMPWLRGCTLEQLGKLTRAEARRIFESIAAGVAALHAKGMRHQDIKPSNVFLARVDGFDAAVPMLLDLGVAAQGADGPIAGSPDYFAPEVAGCWPVGGKEIGPEADVYALALALRNALDPDSAPTVDAFSKESLAERAKVRVPPPRGRDVAYLRGHFERWLAIDPLRRPSANELLHELHVLTAPEDRRKDRIRILKRLAPWAAALAIGLVAAGWWMQGELAAQEKAAALAAREQEEAEQAAEVAREEADEARQAERAARARAASSAAEADRRGQEAASALERVRGAQLALQRSEGDRAELNDALEELQSALAAAEAARVAEQEARAVERTEAETVLRTTREAFAEERARLTGERDRAASAAADTEVRARAAEAATIEAEARATAARTSEEEAQQRIAELERRIAELEERVREASRRDPAPEEPTPQPPPPDPAPAPESATEAAPEAAPAEG
jgi:hypothetical protein